MHFLERKWVLIKISLEFVPKGPINNSSNGPDNGLAQPSDKTLSEPMMVSLLTHICVTRHQLVKVWFILFSYNINVCVIRWTITVILLLFNAVLFTIHVWNSHVRLNVLLVFLPLWYNNRVHVLLFGKETMRNTPKIKSYTWSQITCSYLSNIKSVKTSSKPVKNHHYLVVWQLHLKHAIHTTELEPHSYEIS